MYDFVFRRDFFNIKYLLITLRKNNILYDKKLKIYFNFKLNYFLNFNFFIVNKNKLFFYFFLLNENINILYNFFLFSNILLIYKLFFLNKYQFVYIFWLLVLFFNILIFKYFFYLELFFFNCLEKLNFGFRKKNICLLNLNRYENLETIYFFYKINKIIFSVKKYFEKKIFSISIICHDLRIPLTRIRLIMDIMNINKKKQFLELVKLVNDDIKECDLLITYFLNLLKNKEGIFSRNIDLNFLINEIINKEMYRFKNIVNNLSYEKIILNIDILSIKRVIFNIIDNAIYYSNNWIKISSGYDVINNKKYAWFKVEDDGCGISKEKIKNIFKLFVKDNYNIKSFGIGLFIVHKIVKENFGKIETGVSERNGFLIKIYLVIK